MFCKFSMWLIFSSSSYTFFTEIKLFALSLQKELSFMKFFEILHKITREKGKLLFCLGQSTD